MKLPFGRWMLVAVTIAPGSNPNQREDQVPPADPGGFTGDVSAGHVAAGGGGGGVGWS